MFRYLQYMLEVQNKDGVLVVDSRLIAEELGIQHKSLLETADSHITEIEFSPLGTLSFDEREFKTSQGNTCKERWIWLTEGQANFLMSLSRNTEKVVQAKLNLVVAFEKAKHALQKQEESLTNLAELIQNMHQELINQRMQMNVLTERTQRLDAVEQELAQINEADQL